MALDSTGLNGPPCLRSGGERALFVGAVLALATVYQLTYAAWVADVHASWGFGWRPPPALHLAASYVLAVIPAIWMPLLFRRPSQFLFLLQYLIIYIPTLFVSYHSLNPAVTPDRALLFGLVLFGGISVLQLSLWLPVLRLPRLAMRPGLFWIIFLGFTGVLFAYVAVKLSGSFRIAGFEEMYAVREETARQVSEGAQLGGYAQLWLAGLSLPFLFAVAVYSRRWWLLIPVVTGYVFLFGIGGSKSLMFAVVFLMLIHLWLRREDGRRGTWLAVGLMVMLGVPILLEHAGPVFEVAARWYVAIVNVRMFGIPQLLHLQYAEFFEVNPLTFGSHIRGVSQVVANPYSADIPYTVGEYFYGVPVGANVGMWAQDGIASFGMAGVLVISAICGLFFWILDSCCIELKPGFVASCLGFAAVAFTNVSLFTTLLSVGVLLFLLMAPLIPRAGMLAHAFRSSPADY
jgi:hypothetical protein